MSAPKSHPLGEEYDRSLLAATPAVSKAAKQESYNVDLLDQEQRPPSHPPTRRTTDPEAQYPKESYTNLNSTLPQQTRLPWYKTRGGMIGLAILAIVVVGAVVGGAVGGSVHKSNPSPSPTSSDDNIIGQSQDSNKSTAITSPTTSPTTTVAGQQIGTSASSEASREAPSSLPSPSTPPGGRV
ncbi:hypothetical protein BU17DRAFT_90000 [Hysterangium stoloniferum]|nr:hypothetical protein BU17DRAFT_90000 [Hysterangium stoloniferum]